MPPPGKTLPQVLVTIPREKGNYSFMCLCACVCVCVWGGGGGGGVYGTYFTTLLIRDSFYYDLEIIAKLSTNVKKQPMHKN